MDELVMAKLLESEAYCARPSRTPTRSVKPAILAWCPATPRALDHFVAVERERFLSEGPSAGRDLRDGEEPAEFSPPSLPGQV